MLNLESKIESVLLFKNEPVSILELGKWLDEKAEVVENAISSLRNYYKDRGIIIVSDNGFISLGTHPNASELIETVGKEELAREIGRAGLETLALILYKGPISRREIDHIRGVNSSFILRSLLIRGLIERAESDSNDPSTTLRAGRSYSYKATLKLLEYLGVTSRENLPEYENAFKKIEGFMKITLTEQDE